MELIESIFTSHMFTDSPYTISASFQVYFVCSIRMILSVTALLVVGINTIGKVEYYFATKLNKYLLQSS